MISNLRVCALHRSNLANFSVADCLTKLQIVSIISFDHMNCLNERQLSIFGCACSVRLNELRMFMIMFYFSCAVGSA